MKFKLQYLPNIITVSRIFLGIIIASCVLIEQYRWALYLFIIVYTFVWGKRAETAFKMRSQHATIAAQPSSA
ncbi:MAG: hypothetical protein ACNA7Y_06460 [Gammaproteobacteria bacterium]